MGQDSVVSIATHYKLDSLGILSWWGARFSTAMWTSPGAHLASYTMVTGSFLGIKWPGCGINHTLTSTTKVKERVQLYLCSPSVPCAGYRVNSPFLHTRFIHFVFQRFCSLFQKCLTVSVPTLNTEHIQFPFTCLGFCSHCSLTCSICCKNSDLSPQHNKLHYLDTIRTEGATVYQQAYQ